MFTMQLEEAQLLTRELIYTGEKHQDYARTVLLADKYKKLITGENIASLLIRFAKRESLELFSQRCAITKAITPAVASAIRNPYNQVLRIDRIRKGLKVKNENKVAFIETMQKEFYGAKRKKVTGLDTWMRTRFASLTFADPNSWCVIEWDTPPDEKTPIKPRPFEVSAEMAWNFKSVNGEIKWLWVNQPWKFKKLGNGKGGVLPVSERLPGISSNVVKVPKMGPTIPDAYGATRAEGFKYTLYDEDITIVYEQIDPKYLEKSGYEMASNETIEKIGDVFFLVRVNDPKVGYVPAFRIGYNPDEETDCRTFVNPWHAAMPFFEKSLKTVSEFDLTMALHVFPKMLEYVSKCQGESRELKCREGRVPTTGAKCSICNGTGYKVHTSAQDAVFLPMPDKPEEMLDLEKLIAYKTPPIETVEFQNRQLLQLEQQSLRAVFSNSIVIQTQGPQGGVTSDTATGQEITIQGVYNALESYTEKESELRREFITLFGVLAGEAIEDITVIYEYPADYKMQTLNMLLDERKKATDAGAPQFLVQLIDDDIATRAYVGDPKGLIINRVRTAFMPFAGKGQADIDRALDSGDVPRDAKVLFLNFDQIFTELLEEDPGFYERDTKTQNEAVKKKTEEFITRIDAQKPTLQIGAFMPANPANQPVVPDDDEVDEEKTAQGQPETEGNPGEE